jgi:hypothetical protein
LIGRDGTEKQLTTVLCAECAAMFDGIDWATVATAEPGDPSAEAGGA